MEPSDLVQAHREVPWTEPADAYERLRAAGEQPVLLGSRSAHPEARWSFVAFRPTVTLRVEGDFVNEERPDGSSVQTRRNVLGHLQAAFDDWQSPSRLESGPGIPGFGPVPFTGGWVGFLGYELARNIEPTLPKVANDALVPDALLSLCLDAVAFDHHAGRAVLVCADTDRDAKAAEARLVEVLGILSNPPRAAPAPPVEDGETHTIQAGGAYTGPALPAGSAPSAAGVPSPGNVAPPVPTGADGWTTSLTQAAFGDGVRSLKALIHDGDLFQANLATRFSAPCTTDPLALYRALEAHNPAPYMALIENEDFAIVSASPEQLLAIANGRVRSRPIAGTRKRGATPAEDDAMAAELRSDPKEQAEHRMLVDLVRNDVAQVAVPGTVEVTESGSTERHRHVMHLVSQVEAKLRPGATVTKAIAALFPGGTVTGAPKHRAMLRIREHEPVRRGPYTGSAGFVSWSHNAHWSILIRTLVLRDGQALVHAGSGIVADSEPEREWKEANRKARALLEAAMGQVVPATPASRVGETTRHGAWQPPKPAAKLNAKVLLVDNYDSFVHNLADYCAALGATTKVVRNDADWQAAVAKFQPTHVILSPGPGWPEEAGATLDIAKALLGKLPVLGVCLGHQAIGQAFGAQVKVHPDGPVHGKVDHAEHTGQGLLAGLPSPLQVARYHSLVVEGLDGHWVVDARLADGTIMALRHREHPMFGLQFHPESIGTPEGMAILERFLRTKA